MKIYRKYSDKLQQDIFIINELCVTSDGIKYTLDELDFILKLDGKVDISEYHEIQKKKQKTLKALLNSVDDSIERSATRIYRSFFWGKVVNEKEELDEKIVVERVCELLGLEKNPENTTKVLNILFEAQYRSCIQDVSDKPPKHVYRLNSQLSNN